MDEHELIERGHLALLDRTVIQALADGGELVQSDGVLMFASGTTDFPVLVNGAIPIAARLDAAQALERTKAFFAERARGFSLVVRNLPGHDREIEGELVGAGTTVVMDRYPVMILRERLPEAELPPGVRLRQVTDAEGVADFKSVLSQSFQSIGFPEAMAMKVLTPEYILHPEADAWIADLDGEPVAGAMVITTRQIGGIVWVGTLESARGRGAAQACTRAAANSGFDRGATHAWLEASVMGEPVYERMGFEHLFNYRLYMAPSG